jgi:ribonucleoside-diphosphate reductase alpha chain
MRQKDGFYQLEKDKEAVDEYLREIEGKSLRFNSVIERIQYMIENGYYYPVFDEYHVEDIERIHAEAVAADLSFASYMAASKFYRDYSLKSRDKKTYLETYPERLAIMALYLGRGDVEKASELLWGYINGVQPATPTTLNAGKARRGELVSCFLLELDDSLNSIGFNYNTAMQLSKVGGGVAINLSKLREQAAPIQEEEGAAKGAFPVAKQFEGAFGYADQMGQRKGAGAVYYNIFGWDILQLLDSKKVNADEGVRLKTLSLGVIVPDKFVELAAHNDPYYVFGTYSVHKEYGVHLDDMDMDEMYEQLVANPKIRKKELNARDMLTKIAVTQLQSGYPYLMYKDNANRDNALKALGEIKMSNLCTEIFQIQKASIIRDYGEEDEINLDISCNLVSLNINTSMESGDLRRVIHSAVDSATAVSDMTDVKNAPSVRKANKEMHSIGIGMMNLHGYLVKNKISYQSAAGREFASAYAMALNFYSLERSMQIAKERGDTFKGFEKSTYATGEYFTKYLENDYRPTTPKIAKLFEDAGIILPGPADWAELKPNVILYGIWHSNRLAVAPTQSISYVQNATSSVMPIVDLIETRTYGNSTTYYPAPFLDRSNMISYTTAYNMDQMRILDMVAAIQEHVDQGISTILFVDSKTPTNQLARYYLYAHHLGLKSLYYTRNKLLSVEQCTSCAV